MMRTQNMNECISRPIKSVQTIPQGEGNKNKNMFIVGILVVVVVVVAVTAIVLMGGNLGSSSIPTASVQPTATASSLATTQTPAPSSTALNVAGATSLKYSVTITGNGTELAYDFYGKNVGTNNFMMRIEGCTPSGVVNYVFNGGQQKAWMFTDNQLTDISTSYNTYYSTWDNLWVTYVNALELGWTGNGDYSYGSQGTTVTIYDIYINPNLNDALFENM